LVRVDVRERIGGGVGVEIKVHELLEIEWVIARSLCETGNVTLSIHCELL
jgi:hypothetical protein